MPKVVGILGGMGPYATSAFFQTVLSLTPAERDWHHLRIVIDDNPHIPSRTRHLLYGEPSPLPGMLESCRKLEAYPVDLIALPCNSASIFVPELQEEIGVPILNIIEVTAAAVASQLPDVRRVAVLGGHVTYTRRTYAPFLEGHGLELVDHGDEIQTEVERQIERLKLGTADPSDVRSAKELLDRLKEELGVDAAIMACTEFGCLPEFNGAIPTVDSSYELARHTVSTALS